MICYFYLCYGGYETWGKEILQGDIKREEYYSIKEAAKVLGVTDRTIRNRIDAKTLPAVWYDAGIGKSQWLIPIAAAIGNDVTPLPRRFSLTEIKLALKEEIRQELKQELDEIKHAQIRIENAINERDKKLIESIRLLQEKHIKTQEKPWYRFWN